MLFTEFTRIPTRTAQTRQMPAISMPGTRVRCQMVMTRPATPSKTKSVTTTILCSATREVSSVLSELKSIVLLPAANARAVLNEKSAATGKPGRARRYQRRKDDRVLDQKSAGASLPGIDRAIIRTEVHYAVLDDWRIDRVSAEQRMLPEERSVACRERKYAASRLAQVHIENVVVNNWGHGNIYGGKRYFFVPELSAVSSV